MQGGERLAGQLITYVDVRTGKAGGGCEERSMKC